ncbi:hypothetical protein BDA96_08G167000 [Sorghum bicolor]|uniref:Uncharacterized protein n=1 Tax=Sorghum bicolor TaxID=4558 RepID=A0A921QIK4_SORBI|nr:hypothetical protein BDA96_08G167000 [Sorghum bicolor]
MATHLTGPVCPVSTARRAWSAPSSRRHTLMVRSADPLTTTRPPATARHSTAILCPHSAPPFLGAAPGPAPRRHCQCDTAPSEEPTYTTRASTATAIAVTALSPSRSTRSMVCHVSPSSRRPFFFFFLFPFAFAPRRHTLTVPSAEPVRTSASKPTAATALTASVWAYTDSRHLESDTRHTLKVRSHDAE